MKNKMVNHEMVLMLEERRKKLEHKTFDWAAWKKGTLLVLKNIFGEKNHYYKQLNDLEYEYNSWSLRDNSGSNDSIKTSCSDLIDICIIDVKGSKYNNVTIEELSLDSIISKFLPEKIISKIKLILSEDTTQYVKEEKLTELLKSIDRVVADKLLAAVLTANYKWL